MTKQTEKNMSKTYIIIAIIIGVSILGYGLLDYNYKNKALEEKSLEEKNKQTENEIKYNNCIQDAYTAYTKDWNMACTTAGNDNECTLPTAMSKPINETRREREKDCLYRFGK